VGCVWQYQAWAKPEETWKLVQRLTLGAGRGFSRANVIAFRSCHCRYLTTLPLPSPSLAWSPSNPPPVFLVRPVLVGLIHHPTWSGPRWRTENIPIDTKSRKRSPPSRIQVFRRPFLVLSCLNIRLARPDCFNPSHRLFHKSTSSQRQAKAKGKSQRPPNSAIKKGRSRPGPLFVPT
jgi:hypothetical protein